MKTVRLLLKSILLIVLFYSCNNSYLLGQAKEDKWDYPIRPGMSEWATLKTDREKFNACQIPQIVLNTISTTDLLELCIDYPLFHRVILSKNIQVGLYELSGKFNGLSELSKRNDLDLIFIERYRNLQIPDSFEALSDNEIKRIVAEAWRLELLLVHFGLTESCNSELIDDFFIESSKKYQVKRSNPDIFSSFSYILPFCIMTKSLYRLSPEVNDLVDSNQREYKNLIEGLIMPSGSFENKISGFAESYLLKKTK